MKGLAQPAFLISNLIVNHCAYLAQAEIKLGGGGGETQQWGEYWILHPEELRIESWSERSLPSKTREGCCRSQFQYGDT